jgi:hypothetical protein
MSLRRVIALCLWESFERFKCSVWGKTRSSLQLNQAVNVSNTVRLRFVKLLSSCCISQTLWATYLWTRTWESEVQELTSELPCLQLCLVAAVSLSHCLPPPPPTLLYAFILWFPSPSSHFSPLSALNQYSIVCLCFCAHYCSNKNSNECKMFLQNQILIQYSSHYPNVNNLKFQYDDHTLFKEKFQG